MLLIRILMQTYKLYYCKLGRQTNELSSDVFLQTRWRELFCSSRKGVNTHVSHVCQAGQAKSGVINLPPK